MFPEKIYYEPEIFDYPLGNMLSKKYESSKWIATESHNSIPELQAMPNTAFPELKRLLVIGVRKTHRYVPNDKSSDFLVPYTSSGCSASCLYCYLVCHYNKCSYLRLFVNREQMLEKLIRTSRRTEREATFEIGSNSDLVLENTVTGNLPWTIENFAREGRGRITFPTKFCMVEPLLKLDHRGKCVPRVSVNPPEIIRTVEPGTSPLDLRIDALNTLRGAGYPVGMLVAPVILLPDWKRQYAELFDLLDARLGRTVKESFFIEVILMTYSYVQRAINAEAYPGAPELYSPEAMTGRGMGKYCYRPAVRAEAEAFLKEELCRRFGKGKILYIS